MYAQKFIDKGRVGCVHDGCDLLVDLLMGWGNA